MDNIRITIVSRLKRWLSLAGGNPLKRGSGARGRGPVESKSPVTFKLLATPNIASHGPGNTGGDN